MHPKKTDIYYIIRFISTVFAVILSYLILTIIEFKCSLYGKQFKFKTARNRHEKTVHIGSIASECQSCGKKINRNDNFDRHVRTFKNSTKCPYCVKHFRTSNLKRLQIQTEHKKHVLNCQRTFLTLRHFQHHEERCLLKVSMNQLWNSKSKYVY